MLRMDRRHKHYYYLNRVGAESKRISNLNRVGAELEIVYTWNEDRGLVPSPAIKSIA